MNYQVIQKGDDNGNGMVVRFRLPSGLEIFGLPTKNFYGGHWDLGPTWNYAVMADEPFLVDTGRFGQGRHLLQMMQSAGLRPSDFSFVLISHGHEDHDGGLAELVKETGLRIKAHKIYDLLIKKYPGIGPEGPKKTFPAKCWHCPMPESFYKEHCLGYHQVLQGIHVETIEDGAAPLSTDIETRHLPGHSPDSLVIRIGEEALIPGDVVLPDISPWPTRVALYHDVSALLSSRYPEADAIFGLLRYIRSLRELLSISHRIKGMMVFPAHRLFYQGRWQVMDLSVRLAELLQHHVQRCGAILEILSNGTQTAQEIARKHFEASLLEGFGEMMAVNEIISHCELMLGCGDLEETGEHRYSATGSHHFESRILAEASD